ncbi:MAG: helix-turn-helix domain-containing protein [Acidobacteriota bacterium]|nr:helix-turn-helix domain-containing protein [Acidobacteriota bacterium]
MLTETSPKPSRLLPAKGAARDMGIPYTSLRDLVLRGEIPVVKIGTAWYFDRRDLDRFIQHAKETL